MYSRKHAGAVLLLMMLSGCATDVVKPVSTWQRYAGLPEPGMLSKAKESAVVSSKQKTAVLVFSKNVETSVDLLNRCRQIDAQSGTTDAVERLFGGKDIKETAQTFSVSEATLYGVASALKSAFAKVSTASSLPEAFRIVGDADVVGLFDFTIGDTRCVKNDLTGDTGTLFGDFSESIQFLNGKSERICEVSAKASYNGWGHLTASGGQRGLVDDINHTFATELAKCVSP